MKNFITLLAFAFAILVVSACGNPSTPVAQSAPTSVPTQPPAVDYGAPADQPTATQAAPAGGSARVEITMADNTIRASQTTFQVGVPYTFVVINSGDRAHNFNINPPISVAGSLNAALDQALLS